MKPVLQALVLAERIWEDKNGQKIIAGTFNGLTIRQGTIAKEVENESGEKSLRVRGGLPGTPYAYISLTDVCDHTKIELQFVSLKKNKVLFETDIVIRCSDRLRTVEVVAALPPLSVTTPGAYAFEVVCEGEVIGSHRLIAKKGEDL